MQNGRVEVYVHSDSITENKGVSVVRVHCDSEAASRTDEFKTFCKRIAMMGYGCKEEVRGKQEENIFTHFPELEEEKKALEKLLKETITVDIILILDLEH